MRVTRGRGLLVVLFGLLGLCSLQRVTAQVVHTRPPAGPSSRTNATASKKLLVAVLDENGVAVPDAHVTITGPQVNLNGETDHAGRVTFFALQPGAYSLRVEKPGFYRLDVPEIRAGETDTVEATLRHEQEVRETIDVTESPPAIDAEQTSHKETLTTREIVNVPYPTSRDIRQALPLLPGIVRDQSGLIHVGGASVTQTFYLLDGFNIGLPTTSFEDMHVSADAVRLIDAQTSRFSAEYGKGISVLGLGTGIGDDKFRFSATNFIPSFQLRKGLNFNQWVPRATVSGPLYKGKVWFFDSPDAEYNLTIVPELPDGADRSTSWRVSNLSKVQINITPSNILSTELLVNSYHAQNAGLTVLNPVETTVNTRTSAWMAAIRDQYYFHSGALLEAGIAVNRFEGTSTPLGNLPYTLQPGKTHGSFFEGSDGTARRVQGLTNFYLAPVQWHGKHEIRFGATGDEITYDRSFSRQPIFMVTTDGALLRESTFSTASRLKVSNFEASAYAQDRWAPTSRLLIESGLRLDWDEIIRDALISPRVAATYMLAGDTKISAGVGVFYQATNLDLIGRPQAGTRFDTFSAPNGIAPLGVPVATQFVVNQGALTEPKFFSWSLGFERKLPKAVYLHIDFVQKRSNNGFVYLNTTPTEPVGTYVLTNARKDRYNALTISAQHTFRDQYPVFVAYTRSSAHTNNVFDFNPSNPVIGLQQSGPLPWDSPNRVLTWGWTPFLKKTTLGYALEWRNGYPFIAVDAFQEVAGTASQFRYPPFYEITLSLEKRFHLAGYYLALRGTSENVTNRRNPIVVDNNINSPTFRSFTGLSHRVFTARIRFLGRVKDKDNQKATQPNSKP